MNQELANVIKIYATGEHIELSKYLIGKSKDTLIGILVDLLTMYINDKNSSTIREFLTVTLAGYVHKEGKIAKKRSNGNFIKKILDKICNLLYHIFAFKKADIWAKQRQFQTAWLKEKPKNG
ncbi:MAG: hypothetical protein HY769_03110 [Candidatus Stahlbacteria bacterium]|nr:hypothetical protein [Candidatus Stahlbacteria bacterium]